MAEQEAAAVAMEEPKQEKKNFSGAEAMMECLLAENVDTIFGYPGGAIMPTFDALYDYDHKINVLYQILH